MKRHSLTPLSIVALLPVFAAALLFGGPDTGLDPPVLAAFRFPALVPAARALTHFGDFWTVLGAVVIAAAWLSYRRHFRRAGLLLVILLSEKAVVEGLKAAFDRGRPDPAGRLVAVHNMAFPSGHSANAMTGWLAIAVVAFEPGLRRPAVAAALGIALIVGLCRLVLGVHWPSDVIGGWTFGIAWVLLLSRFAGSNRNEAGLGTSG
jgi:undecaprenyl-diphosphatase